MPITAPEVVTTPSRVLGTTPEEVANISEDRGQAIVALVCPHVAEELADEEPPMSLIPRAAITFMGPVTMEAAADEALTREATINVGRRKTTGLGTNRSLRHTSRKVRSRGLL